MLGSALRRELARRHEVTVTVQRAASPQCSQAGSRLVHFSTDCVFSGRGGSYRETDLPDPPDLYGRSKLLDEVDAPHLTLRSSIIGLELFGFPDYVRLETSAAAVLSDSGTLTEEAAILGFPAAMIRDAHERPEGMEAGVAVMAGLAPERVLQAVELVRAQSAAGACPRSVPDYEAADVSKKVVRIVLSYTDYVNRVVWRRA